MKSFSKSEIKSISLILLVLFSVTIYNMLISLRRGRDATRKNDIYAVEKALDTYYQKYRVYPLATGDGKIVGCFDEEVKLDSAGKPINPVVCDWGISSFEEIKTMPRDPYAKKGTHYLYVSDGKSYKFYVALEGEDEAEYTPAILSQNLQCGSQICNYGRGVEK
jgi:hypothetical protein